MSETSTPPAPAGRPVVFADAITDVIVSNGVVRLTLAMNAADARPTPVAVLCVPVTQLPAIVNGLGNLMQQLQEKVRAAQQAAQPSGLGAPDSIAAADAAFRFRA